MTGKRVRNAPVIPTGVVVTARITIDRATREVHNDVRPADEQRRLVRG